MVCRMAGKDKDEIEFLNDLAKMKGSAPDVRLGFDSPHGTVR